MNSNRTPTNSNRTPLDAFLAAVKRARADLPHGKRPTDLHVAIAHKLAYWRSPVVRHRALARAARCSRSSVLRGLQRLADLGLLHWTRRVVAGPGWRLRTANAYTLAGSVLPKPLATQVLITGGKLEQPATSATLVAIRARREAAVNADWLRRRRPTAV